MRKSILLALIIVLVLPLTSYSKSDAKFGVGVNFNATGLYGGDDEFLFIPVGLTNIQLPIEINGVFRIEPEIGFFSFSEETKEEDEEYADERNSSNVRLAAGLFYVLLKEKDFQVNLGLRAGIILMSSEYTYEADTKRESSQNAIFFGAALGGEYFLGSQFSLGAEVQLNYITYSKPEIKIPGDTNQIYDTYDRSLFTTNAVVIARFYFN